jgi:hypothetical protein
VQSNVRLRPTAVLVVAEVALVVALVRLSTRAPFDLGLDLSAWRRAAPEDALAAALRWVALGAAGWLLAVTLACVATTALGRCVRVGTPQFVRRLVDRTVVSGLVVGALVVPALAPVAVSAGTRAGGADTPAVTVIRDGRAGTLDALPAAPAPTTATVTPAAPSTRAPERATSSSVPAASSPLPVPSPAPVPAPPSGPAPRSSPSAPAVAAGSDSVVIVVTGDDLWEIAARELARVRAIDRAVLTDADVAPYWLAVCDANRASLASGDVDWIFPGESVRLPHTG